MKPSRITWTEIPDAIRARVETALGSTVASHTTQPVGNLPGAAEHVVTAEGRRAFVKLSHPGINPETPDLLRRELHVLRHLPEAVPAPRLVDGFDEDGWVGVVMEDVVGDHPRTPWSDEDLEATLDALVATSRAATPCPVPDLPPVAQSVERAGSGWTVFLDRTPDDLDPWLAERLPEFAGRVDRLVDHCEGDSLVHNDIRSHDVVLRTEGPSRRALLVDWSWAGVGPAWTDAASLVVDLLRTAEPHQPDWARADRLVTRITAEFTPETGRGPASEAVVTYLIAWLGNLEYACRQPELPGLTGLRAHQRATADALRGWLWVSEHFS